MTLFLGRCDRCQRSIVATPPAATTGLVQVEAIIKPLEMVVAVDPANGPDSGSTILAGRADDGQFVVLAYQVDESGQAAGETSPPDLLSLSDEDLAAMAGLAGAELLERLTGLRRREEFRKPFLDRIARAVGLQDSSLIIDGMAELVEAMAAELARADSAATASLEMARGYQAAAKRAETERDEALAAFALADDLAKALQRAADRDADVIEVLGGGVLP
jgi:hypothetical protein